MVNLITLLVFWKKTFLKLKVLAGAFLLYRASSGGPGSRQLTKIPMGKSGYSLEWLRCTCNIGSSSTIYVVPFQKYLDLSPTSQDLVSLYIIYVNDQKCDFKLLHYDI